MLFHVSIQADNPRHMAHVLAELMGGEALPFPAVIDGSWVAFAGDDRGTIVEVYPRGTEIHSGPEEAEGRMADPRRHGATHIAIGSPLDRDAILAICEREGWQGRYCRRGDAFGLVELFAEGCQMIEVLSPDMQREYVGAVTIANWKAMLAAQADAEVKQAA